MPSYRALSLLPLLLPLAAVSACGSSEKARTPTASAAATVPAAGSATPAASASTSTKPVARSSASTATTKKTVTGTGYSLTLPTDFVHYSILDTMASAENSSMRSLSDGTMQLVGVAVRDGGGTLEEAAQSVAEAARQGGATGVTVLPAVQLDGVPAIPVTERRLRNGTYFQMREYVVLHGGHRYQLGVGASNTDDDAALEAQLGGLLDGWKWS